MEQGRHRQSELLHHPGYGSFKAAAGPSAAQSITLLIRLYPVQERVSTTFKNGLAGDDEHLQAYAHPNRRELAPGTHRCVH